MNIQDFHHLYRRRVTDKSDGSTAFRLLLDPVDPMVVRVLSHVSVENETTDYTKCRLGIQSGAVDLYLDELQTIAADELAVSRSDVLLGEGDRFFAELTGTTSGDFLIMTCFGWEMNL